MRRKLPLIFFALIGIATQVLFGLPQAAQAPVGAGPGQSSSQPSPQTAPAPPAAATQPAQQPAALHNTLAVVVVDPGHGGADTGARGSSGITESDVVLGLARLLRIALEAQGFGVILTRQANEDPSFDDRSRIANSQRGAIFITLHVSSTGPAGTVRVYSLPMPATALPAAVAIPPHEGLVPWDHAQDSYIDSSRKLAELVQAQIAQMFPGSPQAPLSAPVRQLRTVAAPAIAIEASSVSLPDRAPLDQMVPLLADGVARAVARYRPIYETGGR